MRLQLQLVAPLVDVIAATKLISGRTSANLFEAKRVCESLLEGESVEIEVAGIDTELRQKLAELGIGARVVE